MSKAIAGLGLTFIMVVILVFLSFGGLALQYDLNHWLPVVHQSFPGISPGPVEFGLGIFLVGSLLSEITIPVFFITWLLVAIGVIA